VFGDLRLDKERALVHIHAAGDVLRGCDPGAVGQFGRVLRNGDRVQVGDEEDGVVLVLHPDPVHQGAEVIAEVQGIRRGLHAGQDALAGSRGDGSGGDGGHSGIRSSGGFGVGVGFGGSVVHGGHSGRRGHSRKP
jgi:hypothetical protein